MVEHHIHVIAQYTAVMYCISQYSDDANITCIACMLATTIAYGTYYCNNNCFT